MKRLLLLICTLLCANVLLAQTRFLVGDLEYEVISTNPAEVIVYYYYQNSPTTVIIPETVSYSGITYSVTAIDEYAFFGCDSFLTSIDIPNSVTSIGNGAFMYCSALTSVTIPNSVTSIGEDAFRDCSSLTSVTIGNSVTSIGNGAFMYCSALTSVTIGNSVTSIEGATFQGCSSLTSITIPNSVTSIGDEAFWACSLTSITIPNSVTSIGNDAFAYCRSLTSVTLPNNATISNNAFRNIGSIITIDSISYAGRDTLVIGNYTLTNIGFITFYLNDTAYNSIDLIGEVVVYACDESKSGDLKIPSTININGNNFNVISIGELAFEYCSNLTSITIPNSVTSIEFEAFADCSSLTSITIPNSVTSIEVEAFYGCSSLTSVSIPNSVTSIGNFAFYDCTSLTSITCLAVNPPTLYYDVFYNTPNEKSLIVPCGALDNYINSEWNDYFANRITEEEGYNAVANVNNSAFGSVTVEGECYSATLTANPTICSQFVRWNDGNTDNPRTINLVSDTSFTALFEEIEFNTELSATICQGQTYAENGFNVSEAGVYTQSLQSVNGCDSIVTLTLNVNPVFNTSLTATICEGSAYTENGFNVSEAGVYTQSLQSVNGCDSVVTLNLNVNPVYNTDLFASICEGEVYNENGFNVNEAGVYSRTLQAVNGCDSVVNLTLSVNPIFNTNLSAFICEGETYSENGFNVSEAGTYTQSLQSVLGCDSIVTLTLDVNPVFNTPLTATICEGSVYNENGFNVSEAGTYTQSLQSVNGCDSIVTLTLNVTPSYHTNLTATICEGSELNISGFNVTEGGVYTQTYTAVNGCDSIVTLTVTALPVYNTNLTLTICEGTSLNFSGFNVSEAGVYTQTHTAVNGCDSIVTLVVTTYPSFDTTITATINAGEMYSEFGFNESEAGTYVQNLQTEFGCDSTITLVLSVNSSLLEAEIEEISFYPNPTNSEITFSQAIEKVEVIDLTGKVIFTFSNVRTINIESLPSGAYYLRLTNDEKTIMRKVIKQ